MGDQYHFESPEPLTRIVQSNDLDRAPDNLLDARANLTPRPNTRQLKFRNSESTNLARCPQLDTHAG
jgi:hypothetical protein